MTPGDKRPQPLTQVEVDAVRVAREDSERLRLARLCLGVSLARLRRATSLERGCAAVFAETSVIVHDVARFAGICFPGSSKASGLVEDAAAVPVVELSAAAVALAALVARSSATKCGRLVSLPASRIGELVAGASPSEAERVALERLRIDRGAWS